MIRKEITVPCWDDTNKCVLDTSLKSTGGSSVWEVLSREDSITDSPVISQPFLVSSASEVSPSLVESNVLSLESSTEKLLSTELSNILDGSSSAQEVLSNWELPFLTWKLLSKWVESSIHELSPPKREVFSKVESTLIPEGVLQVELPSYWEAGCEEFAKLVLLRYGDFLRGAWSIVQSSAAQTSLGMWWFSESVCPFLGFWSGASVVCKVFPGSSERDLGADFQIYDSQVLPAVASLPGLNQAKGGVPLCFHFFYQLVLSCPHNGHGAQTWKVTALAHEEERC